MDWTKLDSGLHAALDGDSEGQRLNVFLECAEGVPMAQLDPSWQTIRLGVHTYTAALDLAGLDWLSDRPWVHRISLSTTAHPTAGPTGPSEADTTVPRGPTTQMRMPRQRG